MKEALQTIGVLILVFFVLVGVLLLGAVSAVVLAAICAAPFLGIALAILFPLHWFGVI